MQAGQTGSEFTTNLEKLTKDLEADGTWDDSLHRAEIADKTFELDLAQIGNNMESWGVTESIPNFETHVENYWTEELNVGECSEDQDSTTKVVNNPNSQNYNAILSCENNKWVAVGTFSYEFSYPRGSDEQPPDSSTDTTTPLLTELNREDCFNPNINYGSVVDSRDGFVYRTVKIGDQTWMAENLRYSGTNADDGTSNIGENTMFWTSTTSGSTAIGINFLYWRSIEDAGGRGTGDSWSGYIRCLKNLP